VEEAIDPDGIEGFVHVEDDCLLSPKFLIILSRRRASCKDVLCLGLNPNSLHHSALEYLMQNPS
jgi:hypothetical protein